MKESRLYRWLLLTLLFWGLLVSGCATEHRFIKKITFKGSNSIVVTFAGPVDEAWAKEMGNYAVYEKPDPDILLTITNIIVSPDKMSVTLLFDGELNQLQPTSPFPRG